MLGTIQLRIPLLARVDARLTAEADTVIADLAIYRSVLRDDRDILYAQSGCAAGHDDTENLELLFLIEAL